MMRPIMRTGNIRNLRTDAGKLIVELSCFTGASEYLESDSEGRTFQASFVGWYREHNIGTADTPGRALAELARQSGTTVAAIRRDCEIRDTTAQAVDLG